MYNKLFSLVFGLAIVFDVALGLKDFPGCCDLEYPLTCSYSTSSWQTTISGSIPDLTNYPGFLWGSNYFWVQDASGTLDFSDSYTVNQFTVFSADYYFNPGEIDPGNYLHFFFINDDYPQQKILLSSFAISADKWLHVDMPCNSSERNYCCGNPVFPCTGKIQVVGAIPTGPPSMYAVDNVGTCQGEPASTSTAAFSTTTTTLTSTTVTTTVVSTTTVPISTTQPTTPTPTTVASSTTTETTTVTSQPTTTHPPTAPECCDFEAGTCDWILTKWTLSSETPPTTPPPENEGSYVYTDQNGAAMTSDEMYGITESTVFSLLYYVNSDSGNDGILVGFQEDGGAQNFQAFLTNTGSNWVLATVDCSPNESLGSPGCCSQYPCNGKRIIEAAITTAGLQYSIDAADFNGGCGDSFPCCLFDDEYVCGFSNQADSDIGWLWSGSSVPVAPDNFTSTSGYVWFQAGESKTSNQSQTFQSGFLTIFPETVLTVSAFVEAGDNANLTVSVHFLDIDKRSNLYFTSTNSEWQTKVVTDLYSSCVSDPCTANVEIMASAYEIDNFYAVDDILTSDSSSCSMTSRKSSEARYF